MQKVGRADREGKAVFKFCLIRGGGGERQIGKEGSGSQEREAAGREAEGKIRQDSSTSAS